MTNAVSHGHSRHAFEQSLPIVAAALGNKCGVRIEMGGRVPSTDGQTITLPFLELNQTELSSQEVRNKEREILGLLCHECGHVRFTNMKAGSNEVTNNFEHAIDNALEDVRIEKAMSAEYLGAEALFKAAHLPTVEELTKDMRLKGTQLIPLFLLAHAEQETLGRTWLSPLTVQLRKRMERSFGTELMEALAGLAVSVDRATCTEEVQAIRKQVMALLKQASQSPEQGSNSQADQSEASEQSSQQAATTPRDGSAAEDTQGLGQGTRQEKPGNTGNTNNTGNSASGTGAAGDFMPELDERHRRKVAALLENQDAKVRNPLDLSEAFAQIGKRNSGINVVPREFLDLDCNIRPQQGSSREGLRRLEQARADSVALRHALNGLVQSTARQNVRLCDRGRKLDSSKLTRLVVGNARVFRTKAERNMPNTAVHLLLDMSGSMGDEDGDLAVRAALGVLYGLQQIRGVNPALTVFPGTSCGRYSYATCAVLKHGERIERVHPGEIGSISSRGGTPLVEALHAASIALQQTKENQKVVMIVTDGQISPYVCQDIVNHLQQSGVGVYGIQIGTVNHLSGLIPNSALINNLADLKSVLFNFAKQILLRC